jgi:hypothetical protein
LFGLAAAAALMTLLLTATASAETKETTPPGYAQVQSATVLMLPGEDVFVQATCPKTASGVQTVPQGGGVFSSSTGTEADVNSSYPDPNGISWDGNANDGPLGRTTFVSASAVCAVPSKGYTQVVSASTANAAGAESDAVAVCPAGSEILGGGAKASSQAIQVDMNSSYPVLPGDTGWQANMNNGSLSNESFKAYAVCSRYPATFGYQVTVGAPRENAPGQTGVGATCPSGVPLGGGIAASNSATSVNINTTYPSGKEWHSWENNQSPFPDLITPYVICAS